ncbi:MAG TPA: hypothetical protein VHM26_10070 [Chitinophagaceae bacterium]|nr:hypothetical protein [Chitinophagaceae bacterium]
MSALIPVFIAYCLLFIPLLSNPIYKMSGRKKTGGITRNFFRKSYPWWKDKEVMKELDRRTKEYESGKVKPLTQEEFEERMKAFTDNKK